MPGNEGLQRRVEELSEVARQYGGVVGLRGEDENDLEPVWIRFEHSDDPEGQIRMLLGDEEVVLINADALEAAIADLWASDDDEPPLS
ncbi:MAG TPA: hypothetical protein VHI73_04615 [Solirubrobacteraceae bacterium]|jgi:hypothetical protein|nr:hypothetical protein [Solirubrobacteraceae bacterium]